MFAPHSTFHFHCQTRGQKATPLPVPCLSLPTGADHRVGAEVVGGESRWAGPQDPRLSVL